MLRAEDPTPPRPPYALLRPWPIGGGSLPSEASSTSAPAARLREQGPEHYQEPHHRQERFGDGEQLSLSGGTLKSSHEVAQAHQRYASATYAGRRWHPTPGWPGKRDVESDERRY